MAGKDNLHDCKVEKCEGRGLNGMKLQCNRCKREFFIECLITDDGIFQLLELTNLLKRGTDKLVANMNDENIMKFKMILGKNTLIEFACKICKTECSTYEKFKKMENEIKIKKDKIKALEQKVKSVCDQEEQLESMNKQLEEELKECRRIIQEMTDDKDTPHDWNENNKELKSTNDEITELMKIELNKLHKTMSDNIKKECKKVREEMLEYIKNENTKNEDSLKSGVKFDLTRTTPYESEPKLNNTKFDTNLRPAKQSQNKESKIYEIYVSKFEEGTSTDAIEQHIMNNTSIVHNDAFKIEEIISKSYKGRRDYIAFKITALKYEIYNEIMDIWAPHFIARDFIARDFIARGNIEREPDANERNLKNGEFQTRWQKGLKMRNAQAYYTEGSMRKNKYEMERVNERNTSKNFKNKIYNTKLLSQQQYMHTPNRNVRKNTYMKNYTPRRYDREREKKDETQQTMYAYAYPMMQTTQQVPPTQYAQISQPNFFGRDTNMQQTQPPIVATHQQNPNT